MQSGDYGSAITADTLAVDAFADTLGGSGKPLVGTSGTLLLAGLNLGRAGTEADVADSARESTRRTR